MNYTQLVQDVLDGNESGLKALALLKQLKKEIDTCISEVEPVAFEEADKYQEKSFSEGGFLFEKRSGGKQYSYKHIPKWVEAKERLEAIEAEAKHAYSAINKNMLVATSEGEEILMPKVTSRKDSLVIKKNK